MDEQRGAELFGLLQHRVIFLVGEIITQHAGADRRALEPLLLHRGLEHLCRQVGRLHRQRGKRREAVGLGAAQLGELLVVDLADRLGGVAVLAVPERIDRQHLHVDRHRVHFLETLLDDDEMLLHAFHRRRHILGVLAHQVDRSLKEAVRVHVDGLDAFALDHHGQPRGGLLRMRLERQAAAAEQDLRKSASLEGRSWVHGRAHLELGKLARGAGKRDAAHQELEAAATLCAGDNDPVFAAGARRLLAQKW